MIHVGPLPGAPAHGPSLAEQIVRASREATILAETGFAGVIVENMHDRPYVNGPHTPEVVACMTRLTLAVREALDRVRTGLTIGVQILSTGEREALAVAIAANAQFIRCENYIYAHVADEGLMANAAAGPLLRYRRSIDAHAGTHHVRIVCDIKKKHASHAITADVSIAEAAHAAEFFGADSVIVTGTFTGRETSIDDVRAARHAVKIPVWVGSGVTTQNARPLLDAGADALIVGSSIKDGGVWTGPVDMARCKALAAAVR